MGIPGNEVADLLAKEGSEKEQVDFELRCPKSELSLRVETHIRKEWDQRWKNYKEARQTKQFYRHQSASTAKYLHKYWRWKITRFINIITGHNNLAYHASLQEPDYSDCTFCNTEKETFFHFVTECPALWQSRRDFFLDYIPSDDMEWKVQDLIDFSNIPAIDRLLSTLVNNHE